MFFQKRAPQISLDLLIFVSCGLIPGQEGIPGQHHEGLFRFLLYFGHLLAQMFLQVDGVLLGVDVDLATGHQTLHGHLGHFGLQLLDDLLALLAEGDDGGHLLQGGRPGEVVLEDDLLGLLWGVVQAGVQNCREIQSLSIHGAPAWGCLLLQMLGQQISPWTVYEQPRRKLSFQKYKPTDGHIADVKNPVQQQDNTEQPVHGHSAQLVQERNRQKCNYNQSINMLTVLKLLGMQLQSEANLIGQSCMQLPRLNRIDKPATNPHNQENHHTHSKPKRKHLSYKCHPLRQIDHSSLQAYSALFISASLKPAPAQDHSLEKVQIPQFPKLNKKKSMQLVPVTDRRQFNDACIRDVLDRTSTQTRNGRLAQLLNNMN